MKKIIILLSFISTLSLYAADRDSTLNLWVPQILKAIGLGSENAGTESLISPTEEEEEDFQIIDQNDIRDDEDYFTDEFEIVDDEDGTVFEEEPGQLEGIPQNSTGKVKFGTVTVVTAFTPDLAESSALMHEKGLKSDVQRRRITTQNAKSGIKKELRALKKHSKQKLEEKEPENLKKYLQAVDKRIKNLTTIEQANETLSDHLKEDLEEYKSVLQIGNEIQRKLPKKELDILEDNK